MRLMVCPRLGVSLYRKAPVTHFVSLIDPDEREPPLHPPKSTTHQLQLIFNDLDDIEMTLPMFSRYKAPEEHHVARLVAFGHEMESLSDWGRLVHCEAGISRSTASAITVMTDLIGNRFRPTGTFARSLKLEAGISIAGCWQIGV